MQIHKPGVLWFTGLSGAGKTTLSQHLECILQKNGYRVAILDGDIVRKGLCADLGYSESDRLENIRRVAEVSSMFIQQGFILLCAFISPLEKHRQVVRDKLTPYYHEIFVQCPLSVCEQRDVKGMYKKVRSGIIKDFTGISSPYEVPKHPDIILDTSIFDVTSCVDIVSKYVRDKFI